jgi:multiple sugar transport system ATP-binding protein
LVCAIEQCDTPRRLFDRPANLFVATFIGSPPMNIVQGELRRDRLQIGPWNLPLSNDPVLAASSRIIVGLRPSDFSLATNAPAHWPQAEVTPVTVEELGHERIVRFRLDTAGLGAVAVAAGGAGGTDQVALFADDAAVEISALLSGRDSIKTGANLQLAINTTALHYFDITTGNSIF